MRRIALAIMTTISGLVLLFSYKTSINSEAPAGSSAAAAANSNSVGSSESSSSSGTYTGDAVDTRWGNVQVRITVENGRITKAEAVQYPQGNPRDEEINAYAVPTLDQEVVQNQSANIDAVSGATVTSDGYLQSLQSAIDKAHL